MRETIVKNITTENTEEIGEIASDVSSVVKYKFLYRLKFKIANCRVQFLSHAGKGLAG